MQKAGLSKPSVRHGIKNRDPYKFSGKYRKVTGWSYITYQWNYGILHKTNWWVALQVGCEAQPFVYSSYKQLIMTCFFRQSMGLCVCAPPISCTPACAVLMPPPHCRCQPHPENSDWSFIKRFKITLLHCLLGGFNPSEKS